MLNTKITIKMLHWLRFLSFRLLPVLRHKSKVAYSSSAIRPSSPADWTSNLENHASRSSNNQQALMGSISLCICPPLLQCPGGNVHRARHSQNHSSPERSPDENSESGHILLIWWCALSLLSHSHRKQGNVVYPSCSPSKSAKTFRSVQMFHLYVSYLMYCGNCFMLSLLSLIPNAPATGMEGNTFPLCRRTALRLTLEEYMNSLHSSEQWLMVNALNKPSTSLHATRVPSMVKNSSRFFFWR